MNCRTQAVNHLRRLATAKGDSYVLSLCRYLLAACSSFCGSSRRWAVSPSAGSDPELTFERIDRAGGRLGMVTLFPESGLSLCSDEPIPASLKDGPYIAIGVTHTERCRMNYDIIRANLAVAKGIDAASRGEV